jgi:hypothetical protein
MHKKGWGIEVLSWDGSCAGALKAWAGKVGCFIKLDDYLDSVVFDQGRTSAKPLNMKRRPFAKTSTPTAEGAAA